MDPLTDLERDTLALERKWFQYSGVKESIVRERFGLTMTAYTQRLNALLDDPRAEAADPFTVRRLRRVREERQASRSARRLGFQHSARP